jgi:hypothetical protein
MEFRSRVELGGTTATVIEMASEVVSPLGSSRSPAVRVSVGEHTYRTTVGSMGGRFLIPLSAENRAAAGVAAGDAVTVGIERDVAPRDVAPPEDLAGALTPAARSFFDALAPSHRKEWVRWIEEAKRAETGQARVSKAAEALADGRKTR